MIVEIAKANNEELKRLRHKVINFLKNNPSAVEKIQTFDSSFIRKLTRHPGDITSFRIASVFEKLQEDGSK